MHMFVINQCHSHFQPRSCSWSHLTTNATGATTLEPVPVPVPLPLSKRMPRVPGAGCGCGCAKCSVASKGSASLSDRETTRLLHPRRAIVSIIRRDTGQESRMLIDWTRRASLLTRRAPLSAKCRGKEAAGPRHNEPLSPAVSVACERFKRWMSWTVTSRLAPPPLVKHVSVAPMLIEPLRQRPPTIRAPFVTSPRSTSKLDTSDSTCGRAVSAER
jgi:hypothetical protein